ncbi:hypothetical protein PUV54_12405 [Hyphococcus flavus]|uniref:Uncharacterized protein n=1 Tax=Hyphococcus flavus TaxID=1866326 RepID=A0AAE9ZC65_9PROT|nr:hypothetical protein [Hyphococcus flavus]WDI30755.1 hypothetical protein PUV54_12405 [Hyphococcus flavus]
MSEDFSFQTLKDLCLYGLQQAILRIDYIDDDFFDSITNEISVDGYKPILIKKALDALRDEKLVEFPTMLQMRATITGKGLQRCETRHYKDNVDNYIITIYEHEPALNSLHTSEARSIYSIHIKHKDKDQNESIFVEEQEGLVYASDRYVSVRDNQEPFDQLERSLDEIKDEFARDHNRGQYATDGAESHLINIDIIQAQIKRGWVNLDELRDQLRPSLQKLEADCKSFAIIGGTMLGAIAAALKAISVILGR